LCFWPYRNWKKEKREVKENRKEWEKKGEDKYTKVVQKREERSIKGGKAIGRKGSNSPIWAPIKVC